MSLIAMTEADYVDLTVDEEVESVNSPEQLEQQILKLQKQMRDAAQKFEFEKAARLRDLIKTLKEREMKVL
jgi:excinuclease ABC subunit B